MNPPPALKLAWPMLCADAGNEKAKRRTAADPNRTKGLPRKRETAFRMMRILFPGRAHCRVGVASKRDRQFLHPDRTSFCSRRDPAIPLLSRLEYRSQYYYRSTFPVFSALRYTWPFSAPAWFHSGVKRAEQEEGGPAKRLTCHRSQRSRLLFLIANENN